MGTTQREVGAGAVPELKALLFDVFGTCVDWRTSVAREAAALGLPGEAVADAWRARYQPQLEQVRSGEREWVVLDVLHREALGDVLAGHNAQSVALARHAGLPWDAILGAEIARAYKPDPRVYLGSVAALGIEPGEAMMVAAHPGDLDAAAGCGLRTAFIPRPLEYGPGKESNLHAAGRFDVEAADLRALAGAAL